MWLHLSFRKKNPSDIQKAKPKNPVKFHSFKEDDNLCLPTYWFIHLKYKRNTGTKYTASVKFCKATSSGINSNNIKMDYDSAKSVWCWHWNIHRSLSKASFKFEGKRCGKLWSLDFGKKKRISIFRNQKFSEGFKDTLKA